MGSIWGDGRTCGSLRQRLKGDRASAACAPGTDAMEDGRGRGRLPPVRRAGIPTSALPPLETCGRARRLVGRDFAQTCPARSLLCRSSTPSRALAATRGAEFVALGDAEWSHPDGPRAAMAAASALQAAIGPAGRIGPASGSGAGGYAMTRRAVLCLTILPHVGRSRTRRRPPPIREPDLAYGAYQRGQYFCRPPGRRPRGSSATRTTPRR